MKKHVSRLTFIIIFLLSSIGLCACGAIDDEGASSQIINSEDSIYQNAIDWTDAESFIDDEKLMVSCIKGKVTTVNSDASEKRTLLFLGKINGEPEPVIVSIQWGTDDEIINKFKPSPEEQYNGKTICVYAYGMQLIGGTPFIEAYGPDEFYIVED